MYLKNKTISLFIHFSVHEKTVNLLLQNGANINAVNNNERTPLQLAIQYGKFHLKFH